MEKECIFRWGTTGKVFKNICGNNDELDVYDCICTDKVHKSCKFKEVDNKKGTNNV